MSDTSNHADCIFVDGLEVSARVGITDEERAFPQLLRLNIQIFLPLSTAARTDDLSKTIDYAAVCENVRAALSSKTFALVEAVAEAAARVALESPLAQAVSVRVEKRVLVGTCCVGAEVWRERASR